MALSAKQQAWIDYYKQGHTAAEAAQLAGYRGKNYNVIGAQNLAKLSGYIKDREEAHAAPHIATMEEVNAFWSAVMLDPAAGIKDRLKASELRAKAAGGFTDKLSLSGNPDTGRLDRILEQLHD